MSNQSLSILLIDDDDTTGNLFSMASEHHNCSLEIAKNVESGMGYFKHGAKVPDIVVVDLFLPDGDGYQVMRDFHKLGLDKQFTTIATTAYYNIDTPHEVQSRGFDGFLPKPLEIAQLIPYLRDIVNQKRDS